jgi:LacI family transcriptional regulator
MTTLKDIAQAAGVHVMTASAVLNGGQGNTRVAEDTAQRIRQLAEEMGYVKNRNAQRLRLPVTNLVGMITSDLRNPFFAEWVMHLECALNQCGHVLITARANPSDKASILRAMTYLRQEGLHKIGYWSEIGRVDPVAEKTSQAATVCLGTKKGDAPAAWFDIALGMRLLVEYLISKGIRNLGFYGPENGKQPLEKSTRFKTLMRICSECGLRGPKIFKFIGESWNLCAASSGADQLRWDTVDGWIGYNDIATLALLGRRPYRLRNKSSIVAFDGTAAIRTQSQPVPYLNLCDPAHAQLVVKLMTAATPPSKAFRIKPKLCLDGEVPITMH